MLLLSWRNLSPCSNVLWWLSGQLSARVKRGLFVSLGEPFSDSSAGCKAEDRWMYVTASRAGVLDGSVWIAHC